MGISRSVRVFLSSTFRDFGEERDLLVRKVFPALRAKLKDRFVELVDVDLRWGITAEQAERGEVLPICLAEIDRSRPYFIGLLGERYGWVPGKEKYSSTLLRQRRWLKDHQGGKSVTELEILHGVLNAPEMAGRARFYFRSSAYAQKKRGEYLPVSKEDRQRQQALKARIRQSTFPVVRYATPADLAKRLERDLWQILDAEFPAESIPDAFARESMRHEAYAAPRRRLYLGGDRYLKTLKALLRKNTPRILITGQSGGGKSALLANALVGMHSPRVNLFEHYLGASSDSADAVSLVRRLIDYVRRVTQSTDDVPSDPQALFESLPAWLAIASAYAQKTRTRWVFVLDALNNLNSYQDLRWLPSYLPPRLSVVVSCLEGEVREALEAKGPWERMTIDPLDRAGQERLLTAYLRRYNKTLPTDLQARALDHPLAGNPLWLKTLAEELRLFGSHEELERRLTTLLGHPKGKAPEEPPTVDDLFEHVLARIEHDHGQKLVRNALTSIWASRAGLSEPELLDILNCPPAIWAPIRYALEDALLESGGRISLAHDYLRIAISDRYLSGNGRLRELLIRKLNRRLYWCFMSVVDPTSDLKFLGKTESRSIDVLYHAVLSAGSNPRLVERLVNPPGTLFNLLAIPRLSGSSNSFIEDFRGLFFDCARQAASVKTFGKDKAIVLLLTSFCALSVDLLHRYLFFVAGKYDVWGTTVDVNENEYLGIEAIQALSCSARWLVTLTDADESNANSPQVRNAFKSLLEVSQWRVIDDIDVLYVHLFRERIRWLESILAGK